ncbi:MAG: ATP-binding protein [Candidatus Latescibacteria bacterium]|nr:ATP-binding protein [Candidatus Latescibacterota bacterium]
MDQKTGNVSQDQKLAVTKPRDIAAINLNYIRMLRGVCNHYLNRFKNISDSTYYEQVFMLQLARQRKPLPDSEEDHFEIARDIDEKRLIELKQEAASVTGEINFEKLCDEHNLDKAERIILATLFFRRFSDKEVVGLDLLRVAGLINNCEPLLKSDLLSSSGTLMKAGLIEADSDRFYRDRKKMPFEKEYKISKKAFNQIAGVPEKNDEPRISGDDPDDPLPSTLDIREPEVCFDNLILPQEIITSIEDALWQFVNGEKVYEKYGLGSKIPYGRAVVMLFYGPSGTGKTATSEAIARQLGKKIGYVSYEKIVNKWVGNSEKNLSNIFSEAKENNCVLLFDEADALFAERMNQGHSTDRMYNNMANILMQELERAASLVILTTNREVVIDKAFERRLLLKLKFDLPPAPEREKIWEVFLKDCPKLSPDVSFEELGNFELAGGKIKNIVLKAVMKCAKQDRPITQADLLAYARQETQNRLTGEKNIGFKN